jgi:hypothetical protein
MEAACVFPDHREPLLKCLLNGSVEFKGSSILDDRDIQSLYDCKACNEENYLTNFTIEAYLSLVSSAAVAKGVKVEYLGWELFERGFSKSPVKELLKGKAPLLEQDLILVPGNPGKSEHWFLLAVRPQEKQIFVVDSKAGSFVKSSTENAIKKMWRALQQIDPNLDTKEWLFASNTPKDTPQQQNSFDCGVFLCFFARSLALSSSVPSSTGIELFRHHMIMELHEQKLQNFTQPCIKENEYFTVEYDKSYYIGRALRSPQNGFLDFKFLHSTSCSGERVFNWPRRDDIDRVHKSCVFYGPVDIVGTGPVDIVGTGPFTIPRSTEVEQVYQWLRKKQERFLMRDILITTQLSHVRYRFYQAFSCLLPIIFY